MAVKKGGNIKFGKKSHPDSPHKVSHKPSKVKTGNKAKARKKITEGTFVARRKELLASVLESIIDGNDASATMYLKEYMSLKTRQIILEKDDEDCVDCDDESKLDKAKSKLDDMDGDEGDEDDESDEESDHEEPDGDEHDMEDDESDDESEDDEPDEKDFKTKKKV